MDLAAVAESDERAGVAGPRGERAWVDVASFRASTGGPLKRLGAGPVTDDKHDAGAQPPRPGGIKDGLEVGAFPRAEDRDGRTPSTHLVLNVQCVM